MTPSTDADFIDFDLAESAARECYRLADISDPLKRQIQVTEFYDPYSIMTSFRSSSRSASATAAPRSGSATKARSTWTAAWR